MRTIDRASEGASSPALAFFMWMARGLRRFTSVFPRTRSTDTPANCLEDLNAYGLRDLGLHEAHPLSEGRTRAARQDARLQEARRYGLMLMMGTGGR